MSSDEDDSKKGLDEKRREWGIIYERERARRENIEHLKKIVDEMGEGKKTPRSLIKLAVYTNGIKAADAADILGIRKGVILEWIPPLVGNGLISVESLNNPNPTIKPTGEVLEKFRTFQKKQMLTEKKPGEQEEAEPGPQVDAKALEPQATDEKEEEEAKLEPGMTYIVSEGRNDRCMKLFVKEIRNGVRGLLVTRSNPGIVRRKNFLADSKVVWLTSVQTDKETEAVSGLQELSILVSNFIDENEKGIVMLEGIEYLISNNNFPVVLRLVQQLRDKVSTSDSKMIIPVNTDALEEKQMSLLENECETLE
ncbi:MAG: DUF835 domain-containing protein [Candidatus Altiarchaeota archaeon]